MYWETDDTATECVSSMVTISENVPVPALVKVPWVPSISTPTAFVLEFAVAFHEYPYVRLTGVPASYHPASPWIVGPETPKRSPPPAVSLYWSVETAVIEWTELSARGPKTSTVPVVLTA